MKKVIKTFLLISLMVLIMVCVSYSQNVLTQTNKENIIQEVCTQLQKNYVYPEVAAKICATLHKSLM